MPNNKPGIERVQTIFFDFPIFFRLPRYRSQMPASAPDPFSAVMPRETPACPVAVNLAQWRAMPNSADISTSRA
jgi:hypothetical protein